MIKASDRPSVTGRLGIAALAAFFFILTSTISWLRWADFQYRTFDLAYYVQGVWQLIHGRFDVSVENVPLLGNHVEPIVFLFAPLFALFRHPMVFVVVQNAALAAMGLVGYRIAKRFGFQGKQAVLMAAALLFAPATAYVALHEFHPEALAAPFLLLMIEARLSRSLRRYWIWLVAVLACKENMALLLLSFAAVHGFLEREHGWEYLRRWYVFPAVAAGGWFLLCTQLITPALNSGNIDYFALYDHLGSSLGNILRNAVLRPQLIWGALFHALTHGNLLWALLLPWLLIPLLRPRWLLIGAPILAQHFLSWRSSEWTIYFHYAAPLLPLFWMATVEAVACSRWLKSRSFAPLVPSLLIAGSLAGQIWFGPAASVGETVANWRADRLLRARKNALVNAVPGQASVVAPFPYLSHLAMRERLYSLHYILKGLKTLSHEHYQPPPPTDFVLIDYADSSTFDAGAGYYHPAMRTVRGGIIPSSDQLLHDFLRQARWRTDSANELTLMRKDEGATSDVSELPAIPEPIAMGDNTELLGVRMRGGILSRVPIDHHRVDLALQRRTDCFPMDAFAASRRRWHCCD